MKPYQAQILLFNFDEGEVPAGASADSEYFIMGQLFMQDYYTIFTDSGPDNKHIGFIKSGDGIAPPSTVTTSIIILFVCCIRYRRYRKKMKMHDQKELAYDPYIISQNT